MEQQQQQAVATITSTTKKAEPQIRKEMLAKGALLFHFERAKNPSDPTAYKVFTDQWATMERKGFLVTQDGCIFPYGYYCKSNTKGDNLKGHQRSAHFFFQRKCNSSTSTNNKTGGMVNQHGWPCDEQISHLCHRTDCIRPDHLVMEERWKNFKRNYCGLNGTCDCGMVPPCVRTYHNGQTFREQLSIVSSSSSSSSSSDKAATVKKLLAPLQAKYSFVLRLDHAYAKEDQKSKNRKLRADRKRKHQAEKKRNDDNNSSRKKKKKKLPPPPPVDSVVVVVTAATSDASFK